MSSESKQVPQLTRLSPAFLVRDVAASIAFYRDQLGFRVDVTEGDPVEFAILARDQCRLFVKRAEAPIEQRNRHFVSGDWFYDAIFGADSAIAVDALYSEFADAGVTEIEPPHSEYGMRVFTFMDPDGYKFWVHAMLD